MSTVDTFENGSYLTGQHGFVSFKNGRYNTKYKYNYKMKSFGVNHSYLAWCDNNLSNGFGWWFKRSQPYVYQPHKDDRAYVSFQTAEDLAKFTWYMLKHNED